MFSLKNIYLLNQQIESLFEGRSTPDSVTWTPASDVFETPDIYNVLLDIPGVNEKDVAIEAEGSVLRIRGQRKTKREGRSYYQIERGCGSFLRFFVFPMQIDSRVIRARLRDGLLAIEIYKQEKLPNF